jgi:hypothetical protein
MTRRKRWPNEADWARLDAIAKAHSIDAMARPILEGESMTEIERIQRAGRICRAALEIVEKMLAVGPQEFAKDD